MKKIIFLFLVAFLTTTLLFGQQIKLTNKTVSDKNSRTLYIGVENEFEVQSESFKGILPQDGVLLSQNMIKIRPTTVGKFTIVFLTNDGENPISFNVTKLPDPIPVFAGQTPKEILKNSLPGQNQLLLKASGNDDAFFDDYKIVSFNATLNGTKYEMSGNSFSTELQSAINNAKDDDIISISDIKGFNKEMNKSINVRGAFSFKIK